MKGSILLFLLLFATIFAQAQQDSSTVWISTAGGNIYKLNVNTCSSQLYCSTGKPFLDIAHTTDGKLWGNTDDSLYQIYPNGYTRVVGRIGPSAALVGLNDTMLLIDSMTFLLSVDINNARSRMIGNVKYNADGDLTWMGKNLYMVAQSFLVKITLDDQYTAIHRIDSVLLDSTSGAYYTPGLTTAYLNSTGYSLIGIPGNSEIYKIDTLTGHYNQICNNPQIDTGFGASSMVFPPFPKPSSISETVENQVRILMYPNPVNNFVHIELMGFTGKISEVEMLCFEYTGRLLNRHRLKSAKTMTNIQSYSPGIYFFEFRYQGKTICRQKLIRKAF